MCKNEKDIVQEMFDLVLYYSDRGYICQRSWDLFIAQKENNIAKLEKWINESDSKELIPFMQDRLDDNKLYLKTAKENYQVHAYSILLKPGVNIIELFEDNNC
jgi:hypothetical protein